MRRSEAVSPDRLIVGSGQLAELSADHRGRLAERPQARDVGAMGGAMALDRELMRLECVRRALEDEIAALRRVQARLVS